MKRIFSIAVAVLCLWILTSNAYASEAPAPWEPAKGDLMVVDTTSNMGYLVREDLSEGISFQVATGIQRNLNYVGKSYYAATPSDQWKVKELDYQIPGYTFGKEGTFLRLYNDDKRTHYGIHTILDQDWLFSGERYKSWGCILVSNEMLSLLEEEFRLNKKSGFTVITLDDISRFPLKRVAILTQY